VPRQSLDQKRRRWDRVWTALDGDALDWTVGPTRLAILKTLRGNEGLSPRNLARSTGIDYELVKKTLQRMAHDHS
jgi:predicted transcriptional regulator